MFSFFVGIAVFVGLDFAIEASESSLWSDSTLMADSLSLTFSNGFSGFFLLTVVFAAAFPVTFGLVVAFGLTEAEVDLDFPFDFAIDWS